VRRIFGGIPLVVPAICMMIVALWGNIASLVIISFFITITASGSASAGHCANIIDISPNFAGTICGLVNGLGAFGVYFATQLVAVLLRSRHDFETWRYLFWVLFGILSCGSTVYLLLCSGKLQSWDSAKSKDNIVQQETEMLACKSNNIF
jgi:ACS family sodium-dependent inorganic phosphate cotransporter